MRLRDKTIEEMLDIEDELRDSNNEEEASYDSFIALYEELIRKIRQDQSGEYDTSLEQIKRRLISYLVRYGTYMKTQFRKDDRAAESSLKKALKYDPELPNAHYRLGFLSYKHKNFLLATIHFNNATSYQNTCKEQEYQLNQQQLYNAYVYLTNSTLYLAESAQESLKGLETEEISEGIPSSYHMSSLYETIRRNEGYLAEMAFTVITTEGKRMCTREECEKIIEENELPDRLILYFSDRHHSIFFNGVEKPLSINQAEMLRYFLLKTNPQSPATKLHFARLLETRSKDGNIPDNSYVQAARRLNLKIVQSGVTRQVIENHQDRYHGGTAYFYNQNLPFAIIFRSDSHFILDI